MTAIKKYTIEFSFSSEGTCRFHSHVMAYSIEDAIKIAELQGSATAKKDDPAYELKATNYYNPDETNWSDEVKEARARKFQ